MKELPTGLTGLLATEHSVAMVDWVWEYFNFEASQISGRFFGDHLGTGGPVDDATSNIASISDSDFISDDILLLLEMLLMHNYAKSLLANCYGKMYIWKAEDHPKL